MTQKLSAAEARAKELEERLNAPKPVEAPNEDLMFEDSEAYKRQAEAYARFKAEKAIEEDQKAEEAKRNSSVEPSSGEGN